MIESNGNRDVISGSVKVDLIIEREAPEMLATEMQGEN